MRRKRRNEQGSIVERVQGRKYLIRWTAADGRRLGKIVKGDRIEAQAALIRELRPINVKPERTFKSFAETEFAAYTKREWKASTQITQGSFLSKHIRPFFDDMELSKILPANIEAFHRALLAKKLSPRTRRTIHSILGTMFYYAATTLEIIEKSPVKKEFAPKVEAHAESGAHHRTGLETLGRAGWSGDNPQQGFLWGAVVHGDPNGGSVRLEVGRRGLRRAEDSCPARHSPRWRNDAKN